MYNLIIKRCISARYNSVVLGQPFGRFSISWANIMRGSFLSFVEFLSRTKVSRSKVGVQMAFENISPE